MVFSNRIWEKTLEGLERMPCGGNGIRPFYRAVNDYTYAATISLEFCLVYNALGFEGIDGYSDLYEGTGGNN